MTFDYYKVFYFVGKYKNITKAAERLFTSQPAVTRSIQNLESELKCRLFIRSKSGVDFTHEGKTLFDYVSVAYQQLTKGEEEILNMSGSDRFGTIYLGTTVTALKELIFEVIDEFHKKHPEVKFNLSIHSSDHTIDILKSGLSDIAFVTTPFKTSSNMNVVELKTFENIIIAGQTFSELKGKVFKLEDTAKYPFASVGKDMQLREYITDLFNDKGISLTFDAEVDSANMIVPMVSHNIGLGIVPKEFALEAIERGEIFEVKLDKPLPKRKLCMVTDNRYPRTKSSNDFIQQVLQTADLTPKKK